MKQQLNLILALTRRDLAQRYKGASLGGLWSFLSPLLLLSIYVLVFREVFVARWPVSPSALPPGLAQAGLSEDMQFALNLFAGLLVLNALGDVIGRAPRLILEQPHLIRRVVFPLPVLVQVLALSAFINALINWLILASALLLAVLLAHGPLEQSQTLQTTVSIVLIHGPLSLLMLTLLLPAMLGTGWLLAATGTYFRDIGQIAPALSSVLMFMGPVFYPLSSLPDALRPWVMLNPITVVIEQVRRVLLQGQWPDWYLAGSYLFATTLFAILAYALFRRVQQGFADVL